LALAVGLGLVGLAMAWSGPLGATTFKVTNGATLEGEIIRATSNTVTLRLDIGSMLLLPRNDIVSVIVDTERTGVVEGELDDWADGTYQIRVGSSLLKVRDNRVLDAEEPPASPAAPPAPGPVRVAGDQTAEDAGMVAALEQEYEAFLAARPDMTGLPKADLLRAFIQFLGERDTAISAFGE
jgi:hypothetical protein